MTQRRARGSVSPTPGPERRVSTEILAQATWRLRLVSVVFPAAIALLVALELTLDETFGWAEPRCGESLVIATGAGLVLISLGMFGLTRNPRVSRAKVLDVGLVYEVLGALGIALASTFNGPFGAGGRTQLWLCVWIVMFPLIVPCTLWKRIAASFLSASTGLLVLVGHFRHGLPPLGQLVGASFPAFACAALALVPASMIQSLSVSVSRAERAVRELGSYRLVKLLGKGGMGEVWQAEHRLLARPAAIKLVQLDMLEGEDEQGRDSFVRRFEEEAAATASLHSPHTVSLYDYGVADDGTFYYVMELLQGLDLESLVHRFGPVAPARAIYLLKQVCDSLAEAHGAGFVHRDVKPANVFLCRLGLEHDFVKVLDFGLVANVQGFRSAHGAHSTGAGTVVGTPAFIAPEMAAGLGVDRRADIYMLGCLGYWLLTGTYVFDPSTRTNFELLADHLTTAPERPSARLGHGLPSCLEALILRCLEKSPAHRPQDVLELKRRLEAIELTLDEPWGEAHARTWWTRNLRELAAPLSEHDVLTATLETSAV